LDNETGHPLLTRVLKRQDTKISEKNTNGAGGPVKEVRFGHAGKGEQSGEFIQLRKKKWGKGGDGGRTK